MLSSRCAGHGRLRGVWTGLSGLAAALAEAAYLIAFQIPARVSCGSGQQHPLRAPQRVQRIAFEIVSSGVSSLRLRRPIKPACRSYLVSSGARL